MQSRPDVAAPPPLPPAGPCRCDTGWGGHAGHTIPADGPLDPCRGLAEGLVPALTPPPAGPREELVGSPRPLRSPGHNTSSCSAAPVGLPREGSRSRCPALWPIPKPTPLPVGPQPAVQWTPGACVTGGQRGYSPAPGNVRDAGDGTAAPEPGTGPDPGTLTPASCWRGPREAEGTTPLARSLLPTWAPGLLPWPLGERASGWAMPPRTQAGPGLL